MRIALAVLFALTVALMVSLSFASVPIRKPTQHELDKALGQAFFRREVRVERLLAAMIRSDQGPCRLVFEDALDPYNLNFAFDCERPVTLCDLVECGN